MGLYPAIFDEETVDSTTTVEQDPQQLMSWAYDEDNGVFIIDGATHIPKCTAEDAWRDWIFIALHTPRNMPAYGFDYGIDEERLRGLSFQAACGDLANQITETAMIHPLTASVGGFTFSQTGDALTAACIITAISGTAITATVSSRR